MTLNQLKPGESGIILSVGGSGALRRRLLDMGLTPKTRVEVRKVAPMGDPIELYLRSYVLTIRKDDAANIEMQPDASQMAKDPPQVSAKLHAAHRQNPEGGAR